MLSTVDTIRGKLQTGRKEQHHSYWVIGKVVFQFMRKMLAIAILGEILKCTRPILKKSLMDKQVSQTKWSSMFVLSFNTSEPRTKYVLV